MIEFINKHIPILIIAIPLAGAFLIPIISLTGSKARNVFAFLVICVVNMLVISLIPQVSMDGNVLYYVVGAADTMSPIPEGITFPIRIVLKIDGFSLFMALISGIITFAAFMYSWKFIPETGNKKYYVILMILMMAGMIGLEFTNDLFNFFVTIEILSISSAALVAYRVDENHPPYAGYKYLLISAVATALLLIGIGLLYAQYGSFNIDYLYGVMNYSLLDKIALIFMLVPLAMKAGAIPMHMWVPDSYSEAPAPITAMLVASSQASLYGLFRLSFSLFGNPERRAWMPTSIDFEILGWVVIILGVLSMFIGVTMALVQHDVKRLMAFHAVSQTGYMLLGVGVGIAVYGTDDGGTSFEVFGKLAMIGGIFHIMNHAFYKGLLFLTSGVMAKRFGTRNLNSMVGMAHKDTFTTIAFIIGALAIAGIPPFNGFASKLLIYESVYKFSPLLSIIAMFVSVLTLASFVKVFYSAFLGPKRDDLVVDKEPVSPGMKIGMGLLCVLVILFGLFPEIIIETIVEPAVEGLARLF
ncbi:MAG: NADH:ubiquinone oxidoreductase [bacterium]|nr:NADH:ubiquinone oxidoreductase [bacterium]